MQMKNLEELCLGGSDFKLNDQLINNNSFPMLGKLQLRGNPQNKIDVSDESMRNIVSMTTQSLHTLQLESCRWELTVYCLYKKCWCFIISYPLSIATNCTSCIYGFKQPDYRPYYQNVLWANCFCSYPNAHQTCTYMRNLKIITCEHHVEIVPTEP